LHSQEGGRCKSEKKRSDIEVQKDKVSLPGGEEKQKPKKILCVEKRGPRAASHRRDRAGEGKSNILRRGYVQKKRKA